MTLFTKFPNFFTIMFATTVSADTGQFIKSPDHSYEPGVAGPLTPFESSVVWYIHGWTIELDHPCLFGLHAHSGTLPIEAWPHLSAMLRALKKWRCSRCTYSVWSGSLLADRLKLKTRKELYTHYTSYTSPSSKPWVLSLSLQLLIYIWVLIIRQNRRRGRGYRIRITSHWALSSPWQARRYDTCSAGSMIHPIKDHALPLSSWL